MRIVFEHWKYIFRNLWFVLPFSVMPAIFLALSVDFNGVEMLTMSFFGGEFELEFASVFRAWSLFRFDSVLGIIYSVFALVCVVVFSAFLLAFVEKHMRIGKRTLSGVFGQFFDHALAVIGVTLFYFALYEVWALVLSAVLLVVSQIEAKWFACLMFVLVSLLFIFALLYLVSIFYLWLPCMQITGFHMYNALLYSYRLVVGVRWRLILSMLISYVPCFLLIVGTSFAPEWLSPIIVFILFLFAHMSFCVRMETLYFETDKLDREDLLRSYKEL